jgi:hypothetical protein
MWVKQLKRVLIQFFYSNKIIPRLEKPETYSLFVADYGLYSLYLHTTARNIAVFCCNNRISPKSEQHKTNVTILVNMFKAVVHPNLWYIKGLLN